MATGNSTDPITGLQRRPKQRVRRKATDSHATSLGQNGSQQVCSKHQWTTVEDAKLVECLLEMVSMGPIWKADNGTFKTGFLQQLEKWLLEKIPKTELRAKNIESRMRTLKKQYNAIGEMLGPKGSGFGWDDKNKCVRCEPHIFDDWVKGHPSAVGLRNKSFPHYEELGGVFGKDRATGLDSEDPGNAVEEIDKEETETNEVHEEVNWNFGGSINLDDIDGSPGGLSNSPISATPSNAPTSSKKNRARGNDTLLEQLVDNMSKLSNLYEGASDNIRMLAGTFKHEADGADRRMKVFDELLSIEGLNDDDIVKAGGIITADTHKTDYFFTLRGHFKRLYVLNLLQN